TSTAFRLTSPVIRLQTRRQQAQENSRIFRSLTPPWGSSQSSIPSESEQANHSASVMGSPLAQKEVEQPASLNVTAWLAAVVEDNGVLAPGVFQGIGEHRQAAEGPLVVDGPGQPDHGAAVPRQPCRVETWRSEGVAEDVPKDHTVGSTFGTARRLGFWGPPV